MSFCSNCGNEIPEGTAFCPKCGTNVATGATPATAPAAAPQGLITKVIGKALGVMLKKPIKLWGLSLLAALLGVLASIGGGAVPIIGFGLALILDLGMTWVYLDGYRGKDVSAEQLFAAFKKPMRSFGGMGWFNLLVFLWSLIPIVGPIFGIIKGYGYSFVPYYLRDDETTSPVQLAKDSLAATKGYKGKMFLADLLVGLGIGVICLVLLLLGMIPVIGRFFIFVLVVFFILLCVLLPLYNGLLKAAWYEEIVGTKN